MDDKIYEKYELIDLAKYGSNARKDIHPRLYVAENGKYPKGDMVDINLMTELISQVWSTKLLFYDTKKQFDAIASTIPNDTLVFVKDKSLIWANGKYYSGGGSGINIDIPSTPIYYYKYTNKNTPIPTNLGSYTKVEELSSSKSMSISLQNQFLYLVVPNGIQLTRVTTSRLEELSLSDNFSTNSSAINGNVVWIYSPVVAPENLTLTFTFSIP